MCGHAGFARHPEAKGFKASKRILTDMMQGIEHRGRHATGFAALGGSDDFIFKIAMKISELVKTERWAHEVDKIKEDTRVVIGHTRWATLPNAHIDSAAHPFSIGATIGAHNGIIGNWRALATRENQKWEVDSEAAIYLLDKHNDPSEALDQLTGDFALAWVKGEMLNFARNPARPLVLAYVAKWSTLYWCSERDVLVKALKSVGVTTKQMEVYHPAPMTIYSFDTNAFDTNGSHAVKATFKGPPAPPVIATTSKRAATPMRYSDANDSEPFDSWINRMKDEQGGLPLRRTKKKAAPAKAGSLAEMLNTMSERINKQERIIGKLVARLQSLEGSYESVDAEVRYLFNIMDDAGLLSGEGEVLFDEAPLPQGVSENAPF